MLELALLSMQQRERAIALSIEAGVAYLKNASSGAVGIATPSDMRTARRRGIGTVLRILPFDRVVDAWQEGVACPRWRKNDL